MNYREMYKAVEKRILAARKIAATVNEVKQERLSRRGGHGGSGHGDPTAVEAIKDLQPVRSVYVPGYGIVYRPEEWLEVIVTEYRKLDYHRAKAIRMRYMRGFTGERISLEEDVGASARTVYAWCRDFVTEVLAQAASRGLIRD